MPTLPILPGTGRGTAGEAGGGGDRRYGTTREKGRLTNRSRVKANNADAPLKGEVAAAKPLTEGCNRERAHPYVAPRRTGAGPLPPPGKDR